MNTKSDVIPLMRAAATLKAPYHTVLRWVLMGRLRGGQDDRGRWMVEVASVDAFAKGDAASSKARS